MFFSCISYIHLFGQSLTIVIIFGFRLIISHNMPHLCPPESVRLCHFILSHCAWRPGDTQITLHQSNSPSKDENISKLLQLKNFDVLIKWISIIHHCINVLLNQVTISGGPVSVDGPSSNNGWSSLHPPSTVLPWFNSFILSPILFKRLVITLKVRPTTPVHVGKFSN